MNWSEYFQIFVVLIISITLYATRALPIAPRLAQLSIIPVLLFLIFVLVYLPTAFLFLPIASLFPAPLARFVITIAPISCAVWLAWLYARTVGLFDRSRWSSELRLWVAVFFSGIGHLGPIGYISYLVSSTHNWRPEGPSVLFFLLTIIAYGLSFLLTIRIQREVIDTKGGP